MDCTKCWILFKIFYNKDKLMEDDFLSVTFDEFLKSSENKEIHDFLQ